jgi:CDP-glucose 4,6-dehydratase
MRALWHLIGKRRNNDGSAWMTAFWQGRKVLLTGHTGFKGAWMSVWLRMLGADVTGFALAPSTTPNLWSMVGSKVHSVIGDITDAVLVRDVLERSRPQIVIHMAAQALVRDSYRAPLRTYATNVLGTANLLQACRVAPGLQCVLVVTSDKVYESDGSGRAFAESDRLGGNDPYSSSKACAELVTTSFRNSFYRDGPPIATARAGNVIGGGDWSADRLIPDCVRALGAGVPVGLRNPHAVRPWQHVLEPLAGYLALLQALVEAPDSAPRAVNLGPESTASCTVREVVEVFSARFGGKPGWVLDRHDHPPETQALMLSSALARRTLGWRPQLSLDASLSWSADWYRAHFDGANVLALCQEQVAQYQRLVLTHRNPYS